MFNIALVQASVCTILLAAAQSFTPPEDWTAPFPAFRVVGNLYGVGTRDLSAFFIPTDEGHILINTGLADSTGAIRNNIESLGYEMEDISILLTQQAHFDHTAALAEIKEISGAQVWATKDDARVLVDGGMSDPHFGGQESFRPVTVERILGDGETITLGKTTLTVHVHPGHTEGSSSYSMAVTENGKTYQVVIANMGTINAGKRLSVNPTYPGAAADFAYTYVTQKAMPVDIWVAAHGSQYGLHDKYQPGQPYDPDRFVDPEGFVRAIEALEKRYVEVLAGEKIED